ncbi:peptidylprolyl isomerase [Aliiroseovarius sp. YM-037]|uniref:peptidylprolyl isomerase n=1 Tax=Aliiroseovarius sp. YM-037 TaxID=3341728 RepID=UPI003A80FF75
MHFFKRAPLLLTLLVVGFAALPAMAQTLFSPAIIVNDAVVTNYELDQRLKFLRLLNQPGNIEDEARQGLIDDRLRLQAADALGIEVTEEQIAEGMSEFAGRAELTTEQFIQAIGQGGIEEPAFRDFVKAGIAWREVVRTRFGPRVQITESEIDRALALSSNAGGVRVLLSEIILPVTPANAAAQRRRAEQISQISTLPAFASTARSVSAAPSRGRGGRIDWVPIGNLPPAIRTQVLTLSPGEVSDPIDIPNGIALFQLRAIEETGAPEQNTVSVEYAAYYIPGGRSEQALGQASRIRDRVDTCDDLYGVAKDQPPEVLERDTLPTAEIPGDIAMELAKLDDNEVSTALTRAGGDTLVFLMLCGRVSEQAADISRTDLRQRLTNQRLASYADSYLAELRAEATIVTP